MYRRGANSREQLEESRRRDERQESREGRWRDTDEERFEDARQ